MSEYGYTPEGAENFSKQSEQTNNHEKEASDRRIKFGLTTLSYDGPADGEDGNGYDGEFFLKGFILKTDLEKFENDAIWKDHSGDGGASYSINSEEEWPQYGTKGAPNTAIVNVDISIGNYSNATQALYELTGVQLDHRFLQGNDQEIAKDGDTVT